LEALHQKYPDQNHAPDLLTEEGRNWLASGLNESSGLLKSPDGIASEDQLKTVRLCLSKGLIEPLPKDLGFYYRLTEQGRREAWLIKINRLKNSCVASRIPDSDDTAQRLVSKGLNAPAQTRRNEELTSPDSLDKSGLDRRGEEAIARLRKQATLKLSPIYIGKENSQLIIRRASFSAAVAMLLLTVGIGAGLTTHWIMKDPISLIAIETLKNQLSIAPAAGPGPSDE
jgi:hypothetical protein